MVDDTNRTTRTPTTLLLAAVVLSTLLVVVHADPAAAQLATITFPDTAVGSSATVKCPTTTATICFGADCTGSSTVLSVTGPSAPFSVGKFNLLSNAEFFGGLCEAHPVSLPVAVGPGQILAYQAVFSPTAAGTFNSSLTFTTAGGPATVNLTGKGTAAASKGLGLVTITVNPKEFVPGNLVEIDYEISAGSLTGTVDLYTAVALPGSTEWLFLDESGGGSPNLLPLRRNVPAVDQTAALMHLSPVDIPFGKYELLMALVPGGQPPSLENLASPIATASVTFAALSEAQRTTLQQRGKPDAYAMFWLDDVPQKREVWLYLSAQPVKLIFVNGVLDSTTPLSNPPPGAALKVDPGFFTPQTSRAQLVATFGAPTSEFAFENLQQLSFAGGLEVTFLDGILSSVNTGAQ